MKSSSYAGGVIRRLVAWVEDKLVRHVGIEGNSEAMQENRKIVDALYKLDAPHHKRHLKNGEVALSQLVIDLEELLAIDKGSWRSSTITCFCWNPKTNKPLHPNIETCRDAFVMAFFRFYLGSPWPLPSVTKFTNR